jgi:hypothetical protein
MPALESATVPVSPPKLARDLPHGLIIPPAAVCERIEAERAKHEPSVFSKNEMRLRNEWTIGYIFDSLCLEVAYRMTPEGPIVLAVGTEELESWRKATPLVEQLSAKIYLGYA